MRKKSSNTKPLTNCWILQPVWINLKGHAKFKEALGEERFTSFLSTIDLADKIATVLTYFKDERQKRDKLAKLSLEMSLIEALYKISFTDFNQLSLKAIKAILPEMMSGKPYHDAILTLGKPANEKSKFLPPLKDTDIAILSPTVLRTFTQFPKVAKQEWHEYKHCGANPLKNGVGKRSFTQK